MVRYSRIRLIVSFAAHPRGLAAILVACAAAAARATLPSFSDIPADHVFGTGSNESGLMVEWDDGKTPDPILWGFRWNPQPQQTNPVTGDPFTTPTTGQDLLNAIAADDIQFFIKYEHFSFGDAVVGIGYSATPGQAITYVPATPPLENATTTNPADHYREFFTTGFWDYSTADPSLGDTDFSESLVGASDRALSDGSWDLWEPVLLPEPASLTLLAAGAATLLLKRGPSGSKK